MFDISAKETEATNTPVENLQTVYGKVTKKFTNAINVTVNGGNVVNYTLGENVKVYEVDTTLPKNKVRVAEIKDIQSFDDEENNRVFLKLYKDVVEEVVIVK